MIQYGDIMVLSTVKIEEIYARRGVGFFPLTVDYIENFAAGNFLGGFNKREGRPSTNATLTARLRQTY